MKETESKSTKVFAIFCISVLLLMFVAIGIRTFTRQVLVKKLEMSNSFTKLVLFDVASMEVDTSTIDIDWTALYPFEENSIEIPEVESNLIDKAFNKVDEIKDKINKYVTDFLPGHFKFAELSAVYEQVVLWNYSPIGEYNNVIKLENGYLVGIQSKVEVSEAATSTIDFAHYCEQQNAKFVYMQIPTKICPIEDDYLSGVTDFSNQNADEFLQILSDAGIKTYDHRADIHFENLNHHELFYKTDHHWKTGTGLWAARHMVEYLNIEFGYELDTDVLQDNNFSETKYRDYFLGSQGKKVTLFAADPEDFSLYYPNNDTFFHYEIPSLEISQTGTFEIMYDMSCVAEIDYYGSSPYGANNYGDRPIIRIENLTIETGPKILIIHRSFSDCEIPFLALSVKNIVSVDLRQFTGSVRSLIEQEKPDIVIVTYEMISESIDYSSHTDCFDFR